MEIVSVMNKKSMMDRDNVELYILSEEEEEMLVDILKEQMLDELDNEGTDIYTKEELEELADWDTTLMDGLEDEEFPMKEWARPNDMGLQEWQEQILKKELGDE